MAKHHGGSFGYSHPKNTTTFREEKSSRRQRPRRKRSESYTRSSQRSDRGGKRRIGDLSQRKTKCVLGKGQARKGTRWMPWHREAMKDVGSCEKLRGVANTL